MGEEEKKEGKIDVQMVAKALQDTLENVIKNAQKGESNDWQLANSPFKQEIKEQKEEQITKPSAQDQNKKELLGFKTYTFLDSMFLNEQDKSIGGVPFGSNIVLVGVPNTGKSLLIMEIALQVANNGKKVCFCTSEEAWKTDTARYDLENRFRERAKSLGLDWNIISQNLFIIDIVTFADMREFSNLISTYRGLVEKEKIDLVLVDSLTMVEDSRGQLKFRLSEWTKYNQIHGLTAIFVSQRSGEDVDSMTSIAGNIGVSHVTDILMCMDSKKVSAWDSTLKLDIPTAKQGTEIYFFRILKNRMSRCKANYFGYIITSEGLVRLI